MDIISNFFCCHSIDCFRLTTYLSENNFLTATHSSKKCDKKIILTKVGTMSCKETIEALKCLVLNNAKGKVHCCYHNT